MKTQVRRSIPFGDLVAAAFDSVRQHGSDKEEVSHLALSALMYMLRRAPGVAISLSPPTTATSAAE